MLPLQIVTDHARLVLLTAFAFFLFAAPGSAGETPLPKLAQLEIGGVTLGKKKCNDSECLERQEHKTSKKKKHSNKDEKRKTGVGIGITIELPKSTTQKKGKPAATTTKKQKKPAVTVKKPDASTTKKKKKPAPAVTVKKNDATSTKKKQVVTPANVPEDDPKDMPVFVPPEFPFVAMNDCEECQDLWTSILWYEWMIGIDAKKLFDRQRELEDRKADVEGLRSKLPKAGSIDKAYYNQEIARHEDYIDAVSKLNEELEKLIAEEWLVLKDRIDQYVECANRHCPKLVKTEEIQVTPVVATPAPPATPTETAGPADSGNGFDLGDTLKLDYGPIDDTFKLDSGYGGSGKTTDDGTDLYSMPPPPLPRSRPPEDPNIKICGPDITEAVIKTLKKIRQDFNSSPEKQAAACRSLIDPRTGGGAWDVIELSPAVAVPNTENPFTYEKEYDNWVQRDDDGNIKSYMSPKPWFTSESTMCAIPRNDPVCAPTVEFFGICEHAQVVNYVQWNFMLGLCGGAYPYVGPALHTAWNTVAYGGKAPRQAQDNMSEVGKKILDKLNANENETDFSDIKDALEGLDSGLSRQVQECQLKCPIKIDKEFDYRWVGLTQPRPVETVRLDKDLNDMADEGIKKLKLAAEEAGYSTELRPSAVLGNILKALGL